MYTNRGEQCWNLFEGKPIPIDCSDVASDVMNFFVDVLRGKFFSFFSPLVQYFKTFPKGAG